MLWLTEMAQDGSALTIRGRSTTLIALSDFVGNLGRSPLLLKPIEIVQQPGGIAVRRRRAGRTGRRVDHVRGQGAGCGACETGGRSGRAGGRRCRGAGRHGGRHANEATFDARYARHGDEPQLSKMPWYGQIGAFVALSLAAAGVFWNWYAQPAQASIDQRRVQLDALRADIDRGLATARRLPEFRKRGRRPRGAARAAARRAAGGAGRRRPAAPRAGRWRRSRTSTIRGFTPQAVAKKQMHMEWPIGLQLEGTYHDLGDFLERVSKFPRIINVGGINIRRREDSRDAARRSRAELTATTFVLIETPQAGAGAAPAAAPAK